MDTHYSSKAGEAKDGGKVRADRRTRLLRGLGAAVRAARTERGLTLRALAKSAHVSERFLVQLETGAGNISVARLADVADALGTSPAELLARGAEHPAGLDRVVALLGLRGAGKTSIGQRLALTLGVPFVELDALVAERAGMSLPSIFDIHGEVYFRKTEHDALEHFLDASRAAVLATSGSLVSDARTYGLLRARARTVWLKARAAEHWDRVVGQGDVRPMTGRANAKSELRALLALRTPLYAQADLTVDTSGLSLDEATRRVLRALQREGPRR